MVDSLARVGNEQTFQTPAEIPATVQADLDALGPDRRGVGVRRGRLAHVPEKWIPVFRRGHARTKAKFSALDQATPLEDYMKLFTLALAGDLPGADRAGDQGLDAELTTLDLLKADQFAQHYRALNPEMVVPTLIDGDQVRR